MKNQIKTIALLGALSAVLVAIGGAMGPGYVWLFGAIAVAMNLASYFYSDKVVLAMNRAQPVDESRAPGLYRMVKELARAAEIPTPRVYIVEDDAPNAFATGRNPERGVVAVTTGILRLLDERELRGVVAHELAHIKNRDILISSIAAMMASVVTLVASVARWGLIFGGLGGSSQDDEGASGAEMIVLALVAPIAATLIQLGISRSREYEADATGAAIAGDPLALASALHKLEAGNRRFHSAAAEHSPATASLYISNPLAGRSIMSWFSTHPPTGERIRRLQQMAGRSASPGGRLRFAS